MSDIACTSGGWNDIAKTSFHLILDIDGTLIDADENENIIPRPYLEEFLNFCFNHFQSVSLWTAANKEWQVRVVSETLYKWNFRFIWDETNCKTERLISFEHSMKRDTNLSKPLSKVWKCYKDMNKTNTLIIDDTPITYMHNRDNALLIPSYNYLTTTDDYLYKLMLVIPKIDKLPLSVSLRTELSQYL